MTPTMLSQWLVSTTRTGRARLALSSSGCPVPEFRKAIRSAISVAIEARPGDILRAHHLLHVSAHDAKVCHHRATGEGRAAGRQLGGAALLALS